MQIGHAGRQHAVDLFRERRPLVEGPQARLDVADGDVPIERAQGGAEHGRRVALHDHQLGTAGVEIGVHGGDRPRGQIGERLVRPHQVEVGVRRDAEDGQHLIEHLAMLRGDAHVRLERPVLAHGEDERAELDGLGSRSKNEGDASSGVVHVHIHLMTQGFTTGQREPLGENQHGGDSVAETPGNRVFSATESPPTTSPPGVIDDTRGSTSMIRVTRRSVHSASAAAVFGRLSLRRQDSVDRRRRGRRNGLELAGPGVQLGAKILQPLLVLLRTGRATFGAAP